MPQFESNLYFNIMEFCRVPMSEEWYAMRLFCQIWNGISQIAFENFPLCGWSVLISVDIQASDSTVYDYEL